MKIVNIIIVAIIAFLSITNGIVKVIQVSPVMEFLQGFGFSTPFIIMFGAIEILGGLLLASSKSRIYGAILIVLAFSISIILSMISGDVELGLLFVVFSVLPLFLACMILFRSAKLRINDQTGLAIAEHTRTSVMNINILKNPAFYLGAIAAVSMFFIFLSYQTFTAPCYRAVHDRGSNVTMQVVTKWSECQNIITGWREIGDLDANIGQFVLPNADKHQQKLNTQKLKTVIFVFAGIGGLLAVSFIWLRSRRQSIHITKRSS